ncbi:hypothetical protein PilKf_00250 [Pillotina sp. SPG140]|jgi:hypothetical protein
MAFECIADHFNRKHTEEITQIMEQHGNTDNDNDIYSYNL